MIVLVNPYSLVGAFNNITPHIRRKTTRKSFHNLANQMTVIGKDDDSNISSCSNAVHQMSEGSRSTVINRRAFIGASIIGYNLIAVPPINAIDTNETNSSTDTKGGQRRKQSLAEPSDEILVQVSKKDIIKGIGLELTQLEFGSSIRVVVKSIVEGSIAQQLGIRKDWVVIRINDENTERTDAEGVAILISNAVKSIKGDNGFIDVAFRNPVIFRDKLGNLSPGTEVTTQIAPGRDTTKAERTLTTINTEKAPSTRGDAQDEDQRLTVTQLIAPLKCNHGATTDDLLEISYLGTLYETGQIFDGSAIKIDGKAIPGRGNDTSLYFVLGKQPFGQFPAAWDLGLQDMCVGERRRLIIPPVLGFGSTGLPRRGIPPNATLQYDITLVSINGLAIPQ